MRRLLNHFFGCSGNAVDMVHPDGEFVMSICDESCGWWSASYRNRVIASGKDGLGSDELELVSRLLADAGRQDLADSVVRIRHTLETDL